MSAAAQRKSIEALDTYQRVRIGPLDAQSLNLCETVGAGVFRVRRPEAHHLVCTLTSAFSISSNALTADRSSLYSSS